VQVITGDQCGVVAVHSADDGELLATKSVTSKAIVAMQRLGNTGMYAVATAHSIAFWWLRRDLGYGIVRGGHTGPIISIHACHAKVVRS
jgi:fructose 1,6-bisphosphatase